MLDPFGFNIIISDMEEWLNSVSVKFTDDTNLEGITYICVDNVSMEKKFREFRNLRMNEMRLPL